MMPDGVRDGQGDGSDGEDIDGKVDDERRREERNMREQKRSHKISEQIKELRGILDESKIPFKPTKFSILASIVEYVKELQSHAVSLDSEHQKLITTLNETSEIMSTGIQVNTNLSSPMVTTNLAAFPQQLQDQYQPKGNSEQFGSPQRQQIQAEPAVGTGNDAGLLFMKDIDYELIFTQSSAPLGVAALDGRFIDCNNEFQLLSGYTKEELVQLSFFNLLNNSDLEEVFQVMGNMLKVKKQGVVGGSADAMSEREGEDSTFSPSAYWSGLAFSPKMPLDKRVLMNVTLARSADGTPKFFNCALIDQS